MTNSNCHGLIVTFYRLGIFVNFSVEFLNGLAGFFLLPLFFTRPCFFFSHGYFHGGFHTRNCRPKRTRRPRGLVTFSRSHPTAAAAAVQGYAIGIFPTGRPSRSSDSMPSRTTSSRCCDVVTFAAAVLNSIKLVRYYGTRFFFFHAIIYAGEYPCVCKTCPRSVSMCYYRYISLLLFPYRLPMVCDTPLIFSLF